MIQKQLYTRWGRGIDPENILPEYPRPQFIRDNYTILNGYWDYSFASPGTKEKPKKRDGKILVPFSPESVLSGVGRQLKPDECLWMKRAFDIPQDLSDDRVILHFGAADQICTVYINDCEAVTHTGGYTPFDCDITPYIKSGGNDLTVCITDTSDTSYHSRGKQKLERGGMYYTAASGIWQSVWMERVPAEHIEDIECEPDADDGLVRFHVKGSGQNIPVRITLFEAGIYADEEFPAQEVLQGAGVSRDALKVRSVEIPADKCFDEICIEIPELKPWSPETPYLYYYLTEYGEDRVLSYFGTRTFSVENDADGIPRIMLNHAPVFMRGILDQGYWPDGMLTPPSDEALIFDIEEIKKCGFNMDRKHAKIESERWYYHCDRKGLFVWQDMVNGGEPYKDWYVTYLATFLNAVHIRPVDSCRGLLSRKDPSGRRQFETEMEETVRALKKHPCIAVWVLFNEGWGQFDTVRLTNRLRELDPARLIDSASGWFDQKCGDFISIHHYFGPLPWRKDGKRAAVISEFGGYVYHDAGHSVSEKAYGYRTFKSRMELDAAVRRLIKEREGLAKKGLCGYVYTQWSDIEDEENGIYTYDREVCKLLSQEDISGGSFPET